MRGARRVCRAETTTGSTTFSTPWVPRVLEMTDSTEPGQCRARVETLVGQGLVITGQDVQNKRRGVGNRAADPPTTWALGVCLVLVDAQDEKNSSLAYWSPGCSQNSDIFLSRM